ncbi:MAG: hypothetical protein ABSC50_12665 [Candidatus Bathyarchaeia archaeon]
MQHVMFEGGTPASALSWMLERGIILRKSTKDPETFIPVQGYILSDEMREEIGNNLVKLFKKAAKGTRLKDVTIGDAFVTATMAAVLANAEASLSQEELTMCTNIILKLLPFDKLEAAGVTSKTLRRLSRDSALLRKLRETCSASAECGIW